jgi:hypothetical protein
MGDAVVAERRAGDPRVDKLVDDVAELRNQMECAQRSRIEIKKELAKNTEITTKNNETLEQVRDTLASFRVIAAVAKWLTVLAGFVAAMIAAIQAVLHINDISPK